MAEEKIGVVTHYFGKLGVAAIELTEGELQAGDTIHVKGHTSDFTQTVDSVADAVSITSGPSGAPNPVASSGVAPSRWAPRHSRR